MRIYDVTTDAPVADKVSVGTMALIFDDRGMLLLHRRTDNNTWAAPGGAIEPYESLSECCSREVEEELGIHIRIKELIGVYSFSTLVFQYPDGTVNQKVIVAFRCEIIAGTPSQTEETAEARFFSQDELASLSLPTHVARIVGDAIGRTGDPVFC